MRLEVVRRPAAAEDLREIWWYSFERWGMAQADQYVSVLERAIHGLAESGGRRTARRYSDSEFFRLKVNRHNLFFLTDEMRVDLVRVLHGSMDAERHLT